MKSKSTWTKFSIHEDHFAVVIPHWFFNLFFSFSEEQGQDVLATGIKCALYSFYFCIN